MVENRAAVLAELNRAKVLFQQSALLAALGLRVVMTREDCDGLFARLSSEGLPSPDGPASPDVSHAPHGKRQ